MVDRGLYGSSGWGNGGKYPSASYRAAVSRREQMNMQKAMVQELHHNVMRTERFEEKPKLL